MDKLSRAQNRKNKVYHRGQNQNSKWQKKLITYFAIGLTTFLLLVFSRRIFLVHQPYLPRLHYVIRQYIAIAHQQEEIKNQMTSLTLIDPLDEIIKKGLRPIQERVSSLRTQTSQYEKMQRIRGGPTSFIESSLKELDHIINHQLLALYTKVLLKLHDVSKSATALKKTISALVKQSSKRLNQDSISPMALENVTLIRMPMEPYFEKEIEELAQSTTLEETIDKLNQFANLYQRLEEIVLELSERSQELFGVEDVRELENIEMDDEEYDQLLPLVGQLLAQRALIEKEKLKLRKYFAVFALFMHRTLQNLNTMVDQISNFEENLKLRYLQLQNMVLKDAQHTKIRIQNLQFRYAKRRSEL